MNVFVKFGDAIGFDITNPDHHEKPSIKFLKVIARGFLFIVVPVLTFLMHIENFIRDFDGKLFRESVKGEIKNGTFWSTLGGLLFDILCFTLFMVVYNGGMFLIYKSSRMWWRITHLRWTLSEEFLKEERHNISSNSL